MPVFTHVLLLKNGAVLAAGEKAGTLNSRNLSRAFNTRMKLQTTANRHLLKVR
jgi:ABC-type cobalamin transport system ATPase subunit